MNFNFLGLKRLIAICYTNSPVGFKQISLIDAKRVNIISTNDKGPYKIEITEVKDENADGAFDISDVEYILKSSKNPPTLLDGDGDFRSPECIALLKGVDIVITTPPFHCSASTPITAHELKNVDIGHGKVGAPWDPFLFKSIASYAVLPFFILRHFSPVA